MQGSLGDCYFCCTMSVLAERSYRVKDLFVTDEVFPEGVFGVKLRKNGEEQTILVDGNIPCYSWGVPAFTKANGNELWVMLVEKAWAKVHGRY